MQNPSLQQLSWAFLWIHVFISLFGAVGIAIMVPHPEIWTGSSLASSLYPIAVSQGGNLQILFGAAALVAYGCWKLGVRSTLVFLGCSVAVSLVMELVGTTFGWPFGAYKYTDLFGFKIADEVPPAIPLSWFYMGFTSFLCAQLIVKRFRFPRPQTLSIALGAFLLMSWDVVLDPAMSHGSVALPYWQWYDEGPYMGMPLVNFLGWLFTGGVFMWIASALRSGTDVSQIDSVAFLATIYLSNVLFAVAICLGTGLVLPALLGLTLAVAFLFILVRPLPQMSAA